MKGLLLPSFLKLRPYARFVTRMLGYELVGGGVGWNQAKAYRLFKRKLPNLLSTNGKDHYFSPLSVPINSITSRVCFSYSEDGWHPFVETLKEYKNNSMLRYENSTLARVYSEYVPKNVQEVLIDQVHTPLEPFCNWPPTYELISCVWTLNHYIIQHHLSHQRCDRKPGGWILFGPHTEEYGRIEFRRLINVYESIKKHGYTYELSGTDPVNGYFMKDGARTRFVLLQGNHRVSALKVLGYPTVDVLIRHGHPAVVDKDELYKWSEDSGGIYSSSVAKQLFNSLFTESGMQKARRLNLVS